MLQGFQATAFQRNAFQSLLGVGGQSSHRAPWAVPVLAPAQAPASKARQRRRRDNELVVLGPTWP